MVQSSLEMGLKAAARNKKLEQESQSRDNHITSTPDALISDAQACLTQAIPQIRRNGPKPRSRSLQLSNTRARTFT